jgi:hypothetical protein
MEDWFSSMLLLVAELDEVEIVWTWKAEQDAANRTTKRIEKDVDTFMIIGVLSIYYNDPFPEV